MNRHHAKPNTHKSTSQKKKKKGVCQITGMRHVELYTIFFIYFFRSFFSFFSIPGWVPGPGHGR